MPLKPKSLPRVFFRMFSTTRLSVALAAFGLLTAGCSSSSPYDGLDADQLYEIGLNEYEEGEFGNAVKAMDRLLISFGTSDHIVAARLLLAHAYYAKGDYLTARAEYIRFMDRYAGHADAPKASLGVCRSLVALSPEPQRDQGYTLDAISICRNVVIDHAGTQEAATAATLANEMRMKMAEKAYMNADFYFRRGMYDSAIIYYESLAELYPETEWAPKALLGVYQANIAIGYDDIADEARQKLLADYPDSEAARSISSNGPG